MKDWAPAFLAAIVRGSHVRDACEEAGISGQLPYHRRQNDEEFGRAWQEASDIGTKALESEAARRAYHGTLKPVFHKGNECGRIREYSDTLLMFLLRARRPKKYRDNLKVTGDMDVSHKLEIVEEIIDGNPAKDNPPPQNAA